MKLINIKIKLYLLLIFAFISDSAYTQRYSPLNTTYEPLSFDEIVKPMQKAQNMFLEAQDKFEYYYISAMNELDKENINFRNVVFYLDKCIELNSRYKYNIFDDQGILLYICGLGYWHIDNKEKAINYFKIAASNFNSIEAKNILDELNNQQKQASSHHTNEGICINHPKVSHSGNNQTKILKILITSQYTMVEIKTNFTHYEWCNIDKETYIYADNNFSYKLINVEGINIAPEKTFFCKSDIIFKLYFEPIPYNTTEITIVENDESNWWWYGIQLK